MAKKTEDNSLVAQYIRVIENPDSVGFHRGMVENYWYQPSKRGYDPNNRGFGVDVEHNKETKKTVQGRAGRWLTETEERELRNSHIDEVKDVLKKWTPKVLATPPSNAKQAMALGMLYRGDGIGSVLKSPALRDAFYGGSDTDFQKAVGDYYKTKGLSKRAQNHNQFMNTQAEKPVWQGESYQPKTSYGDGGTLKPRQWEDLTMAEKAAMMRAAVTEGIYDLPTIKAKYNEFAGGGHLYDGTSTQSQQMKIGYGHYSYDKDGNMLRTSDGKPVLNYNVTLPEVVITPDSSKSPEERAVLERYRRQQYDKLHGRGTYDAKLDKEQTEFDKAKSQNQWYNSAQKKALDYGQAAAMGVGIGADAVSGLPIYSTLKGARTLQRAQAPEEYAEAGLWLAPMLGKASKPLLSLLAKTKLSAAKKSSVEGLQKFVSELDWTPEGWLGKTRKGGKYDAEDISSLQRHIPEYHAIEEQAKANDTWLKMPDGTTWEGDPRSWVQMMSKSYDTYTGNSPFKYEPFAHSTESIFDIFDISHFGKTDQGFYGKGFYTHPAENINGKLIGRNSYGDNNYLLTTNVQNPLDLGSSDFKYAGLFNRENTNAPRGIFDNYDSVYYGIPGNKMVGASPAELVVPKPSNYKSLLGNNGDFNPLNPNMYKVLVPFGVSTMVMKYQSQGK